MSMPGIGPRRLQQIQAHEKVRRLMQIPSILDQKVLLNQVILPIWSNLPITISQYDATISCVLKCACGSIMHPGHVQKIADNHHDNPKLPPRLQLPFKLAWSCWCWWPYSGANLTGSFISHSLHWSSGWLGEKQLLIAYVCTISAYIFKHIYSSFPANPVFAGKDVKTENSCIQRIASRGKREVWPPCLAVPHAHGFHIISPYFNIPFWGAVTVRLSINWILHATIQPLWRVWILFGVLRR